MPSQEKANLLKIKALFISMRQYSRNHKELVVPVRLAITTTRLALKHPESKPILSLLKQQILHILTLMEN